MLSMLVLTGTSYCTDCMLMLQLVLKSMSLMKRFRIDVLASGRAGTWQPFLLLGTVPPAEAVLSFLWICACVLGTG